MSAPPVSSHGIETAYAGILFRSRLEARWAAFFDRVGWRWEYEPLDAEGYIPDFVLLGDRPTLVEVKPEPTLDGLRPHLSRTNHRVRKVWPGDTLALGLSPIMAEKFPALGVAGTASPEIAERNALLGSDTSDHVHDVAIWHICPTCTRPSFMAYGAGERYSRLCGHPLDEEHQAGPVSANAIRSAWSAGANAVRWNA